MKDGQNELQGHVSDKDQSASNVLADSSCVSPTHSKLLSETNQSGSANCFAPGQENAFEDSGHHVLPHIYKDDSCDSAEALDHSHSDLYASEDLNNECRHESQSRNESVSSGSSPNIQNCLPDGEQDTLDKNKSSQDSLQTKSSISAAVPKISQTQTKDADISSTVSSRTEPFFIPNIRELCVSGTVFSDAPASHHCLRRFLESNPGLTTLRLMGGLNGQSVTDEVLGQVTETSQELKHMSVEGCVHLTTAGVAGLAACKHLEHLDLTGDRSSNVWIDTI